MTISSQVSTPRERSVENLPIRKRSDEEKESTPLTSLSRESTTLSDQDEQRQPPPPTTTMTSIINSQEGHQTVLEAPQLPLVSSSETSSAIHASPAAPPTLARSPSATDARSNTPSSTSSVIPSPLSTAPCGHPAGNYRSSLTSNAISVVFCKSTSGLL